MRLSKQKGAIPYATLEAMNNAVTSLKDKCGYFYFDDICFQPSHFDNVAEASLIYSEKEVNYYQCMRTFNFEIISAADAFISCLEAMLPTYTGEQISALAARLKRQF